MKHNRNETPAHILLNHQNNGFLLKNTLINNYLKNSNTNGLLISLKNGEINGLKIIKK
jgi:hypothetical protein